MATIELLIEVMKKFQNQVHLKGYH